MANKTIKDLTKLWEQEKEHYKTYEIGTGVQKFVKHLFECDELFGLTEGKLSTADLKRKKEFLTEARKKGRRADVVIFIDSDIIIPVEVEKFTHIKSGIKQIYNYQGDWTKKYGLLTDGNEWWFFNNRFVEKKFFIKDILEKPKEFLTYWKEYTTADFYYRSFFEKKGQLTIIEEPAPNLDEVREDFFLDITTLIENFENKLNLKGYFKKENDETERKKKAVEITYAYLIQFILYKVLVDNTFGDFEKDWEERLKSIDKAIRAEAYGDVLTKIKGISDKISDRIYKRFNDEQLMINAKLKEILSAPKTEIGDVSVWLDIMLFINRYDFSNVQNEIFGYVYENYLKDLYLAEKKGQYFTDPHVVEFMLNEMDYTKENLQKRYAKDKYSISIIDPSCGSGTFLYNATHRIVEAFFDESNKSSKLTEQLINDNIFGLDIAEFPLYLAEMNILMRMLPIIISERYNNPIDQKIKVFKTRDSISEFLDTAVKNTISDINTAYKKGKIQYDLFTDKLDLGYDSFMRDRGDLDELKNSLEIKNKKPRTRFDFVIGNPPYVGYNECASQNMLSFVLIREGKLKLNDIYGFNLHSVPSRVKKYRPNPNLYAFFTALGVALLKDGGLISYIIPQTLLTAGDLDVVRHHLAKYTTIEKIIVFANKMFVGRGIKQIKPVPTSSLIFIIRKTPPKPSHSVEVLRYNDSEKDVTQCLKDISKRKNTTKVSISNKVLLKNSENWNFIKFSEELIEFYDEYNSAGESFNYYYEHSLAEEYHKSKFYFDGGYSIDESIRSYEELDGEYYIYPKFQNTTYTKVIPNGYWPNQRKKSDKFFIALRQANQEYNLLDSSHKIVWSYANPSKFYFTSEPIIWARNQFNAIGSENKDELLYLFALLNSSVNFKILRENVKSDNEKDILFSITAIKSFIKTPVISKDNQKLKNEIINSAIALIGLEQDTLSSFVDFKGVMLQKFDMVEVVGNNLIIHYKDKEVKCKIKDNPDLVKGIVSTLKKLELFNDDDIGNVSELKSLSAFDKAYQTQLKNYIDDLVYALYFKIKLTDFGFEKAEQIKKLCSKNKYYQLVNSK
jgi:hypothetical protein